MYIGIDLCARSADGKFSSFNMCIAVGAGYRHSRRSRYSCRLHTRGVRQHYRDIAWNVFNRCHRHNGLERESGRNHVSELAYLTEANQGPTMPQNHGVPVRSSPHSRYYRVSTCLNGAVVQISGSIFSRQHLWER